MTEVSKPHKIYLLFYEKQLWGLVSLGGTGRDDISNIHAVSL